MKTLWKKMLTAILSLFIFQNAHAQNEKCFWLKINDTANRHVGLLTERAFQYNLRPQQITDADSVYTLPVVVHVIHTGNAIGTTGNPPDDSIIAMINNLNKAFRKNGSLYGGADMKIQFQLAVRSPLCGNSTGINRVNGSSVPNYVSGGITNYNNPNSAHETAVKRLSRWPNTDYINIWIVNKINGDPFAGGYAYFPEYNHATTDGLVLNASVIDGSNKTIVHEMGHYFFLHHTFTDGNIDTSCAVNTNCATQGDLICDTEPIKIAYDCNATNNSCGGNPFIIADAPHGYTVQHNYMGYTNCQWMFTQHQKIRARAALFSYRNGLISSGGLAAPAAYLATIACMPTALNGLSEYYGVEKVEFNTLHVYSNTSAADSAFYWDRTCNQQTTVTKGWVYPISISGSYGNWHRIKVFIDYNNNGSFNDTGESILNTETDVALAMITIPLNAVANIPLRMRVLADNPSMPDPTACQLTGNAMFGVGQIEDYAVIVLKRQVVSINNGGWNAPATWSCNCVPQADDQVTIKATHSITITPAMGALQCGKLTLETGSIFNVAGISFKIIGND